MNEVMVENVKTFEDLKSQLNIELNKAAISFVRIGYLLKTARDTDILKDTEYNDVNDFAAKEFGLDRSQVSRFMRINDRFSISGYSEQLKVEYEGYGSAKLSLCSHFRMRSTKNSLRNIPKATYRPSRKSTRKNRRSHRSKL